MPSSPMPNTPDETPLTVSELTARIRRSLEGGFPHVSVEGEIGNWTRAASGHAYFSLKDEGALLSAVMWKAARGRLDFDPEEGQRVVCRGRISVFDRRGQYQLLVDRMTLAGEGALWAKFQKLKERLAAEGLFDEDRKRPIPVYPRCVGIVTSPTGAAIRDILQIMRRRAPNLSAILYPARVQGDGAGREIAHATQTLAQSGLVDVLIVGRGGGSLEDLWEFNDETLARAIHASPVPVVSAVGHEVDFTIADFVADRRAPTPSAAAEIVTEGYLGLREFLLDLITRQERAVKRKLRETQRRLEAARNSYGLRRPRLELESARQRIDWALERLPQAVRLRAERLRARLEKSTAALDGHNPELILNKGYAIVRRAANGQVLTSATQLKKNTRIEMTLRDGRRQAVVTDDEAPDLFG